MEHDEPSTSLPDDDADDDAGQRAGIARRTCPYLTAKQAAYHLGLARMTLKRMRQNGTGPRSRLHGRALRYHIDDLEAWSLGQKRGEGDD
ncbi:MAG: DNA-binding protein [Novosphingobium sp. 63-713]|uniref:helix-turn-helix transcriptional regulator n=1 Tax=unclassified Novosphingobium TaxID=2644732 RepID=UPI00096193E3|nr:MULTISPECIES: helix-turn-helix domain-containing protein [unclassified Novosphingobium]MBN9144623.1 helix-turn-helix domain-containing protein [Novosphingobium sp.]OJX92049.1 MAG: DNA-binding protein [Novosphingobium sp. 63-713]